MRPLYQDPQVKSTVVLLQICNFRHGALASFPECIVCRQNLHPKIVADMTLTNSNHHLALDRKLALCSVYVGPVPGARRVRAGTEGMLQGSGEPSNVGQGFNFRDHTVFLLMRPLYQVGRRLSTRVLLQICNLVYN